jgi:hypothetical protein
LTLCDLKKKKIGIVTLKIEKSILTHSKLIS